MGRDQELKWLAFSLYPLSFFLYSPFKSKTSFFCVWGGRDRELCLCYLILNLIRHAESEIIAMNKILGQMPKEVKCAYRIELQDRERACPSPGARPPSLS